MTATITPRPVHRRTIENLAWLHEDGALEIESRLIDIKGYDTKIGFNRDLPAGDAVHDMTINIVLESDWRIRQIRLHMESAPFSVCPEVIRRFEGLRGESMGKGWNALLSSRFAGSSGCRHLIDLLRGMATVAFQSMHRSTWTKQAIDGISDSCHAFRKDGEVIKRLTVDLDSRSKRVTEG